MKLIAQTCYNCKTGYTVSVIEGRITYWSNRATMLDACPCCGKELAALPEYILRYTKIRGDANNA